MLRPKSVVSQRRVTTIVAPLALVLSMSISHQAFAVCADDALTPPGTTCDGADDIVNVTTGAHGAIDTDGGKDTVYVSGGIVKSINTGADNDTVTINVPDSTSFGSSGSGSRAYSVTTGLGDDKLIIYGGTFVKTVMGNGGNDEITIYGGHFTNVAGDGRPSTDDSSSTAAPGNEIASSVTGIDIIKIYGGTITGEVQGGNGDDTIYLYGGDINRVEGNNSDTLGGDKIYLDGANLGSWEFPSGGAGGQTLYLRSGSFGVGAGDDDDDDGGSTVALAEHLIIDPGNSEQNNPTKLKIGAGLAFGNGNDTLEFIGAINVGDNQNFEFVGDDVEYNGGGDVDSVIVTALVKGGVTTSSNVVLGELKNFENLDISKGSQLQLTDDEYHFGAFNGDPSKNFVHVDGTSVLWLSGAEVEFETAHFVLDAGDGKEERLEGLPDYYDSFATGGILKIGASGSGGGDDDDDDVVALDADDDDGASESGPAKVSILTGSSTFLNNGTITMLNDVVGDKLTIEGSDPSVLGSYVSNNGKLAIETTLGGTGSPSDRIEIEKATVSGTTTVYVKNVGGTGAFTGRGEDDGIKIAEIEDASGTAAANSFQLATNGFTGRDEVVAGAFSYRLMSFVDENGDNAEYRLQSDILDQVPAYTAAASVAQRWASSGLGTLYKRLGEVRLGKSNDRELSGGGTVWARGLYGDYDVDPKSGYAFSQRNDGVLMGADANIEDEDGGHLMFGVFGGYGSADADVAATIWGAGSKSKVELTAWSVGAYGTYYEHGRPGTGLYVDGVLKADILELDMSSAARSTTASTDGYAATVSGEMGYGVPLGGNLTLQPQAQLSYTTVALTSYSDSYGVDVGTGDSTSLVGRASLQVQGNYSSASGWFTPYMIASVLSDFLGESQTTVGSTPFTSDVGLTWFEAGGGVTAQLGESLSLYGSAEYSFGDVQGWGGTGGIKARW